MSSDPAKHKGCCRAQGLLQSTRGGTWCCKAQGVLQSTRGAKHTGFFKAFANSACCKAPGTEHDIQLYIYIFIYLL